MPPLPWKTRSTRRAYQNRWITLREDIAELPNGKTTLYGVVECAPAVGVIPFIDDNQVVLVRQYRYVFGEAHRWEIPTGGVKPGETLLDGARRELQEEIGYDTTQLQFLCSFYSSKSVLQEVCHLYLGRELSQVQAIPDETEFLEVGIFPFEQVLAWTLSSEIRDAMTALAVLHAARYVP